MRGHGYWNAMSTTMPPGETGCSGVALGFSSDYLQGRPRGYSGNGHIQRSFQYAVGESMGITNMPLRFTDHTVDHNSYRYWDCCDIRIDKHGAFSSAISFVGYSVRDVI